MGLGTPACPAYQQAGNAKTMTSLLIIPSVLGIVIIY